MPTIHMRNGEGGRRRGGREGNVTTINISSSSSSQSWIINTTVDPDPDHHQQGAQLIGQVRWAGQVASQRIGFRPQKKKGRAIVPAHNWVLEPPIWIPTISGRLENNARRKVGRMERSWEQKQCQVSGGQTENPPPTLANLSPSSINQNII